MSNTITTHQVVDRLNALFNDRQTWETGTYSKSNDELYALLDRCFTLLVQMKGQKKLISELNTLLQQKSVVFNDGTSLATKIARFVFNESGRRVNGYAKVLRTAASEKLERETFAAFIKRNGGVEEVRKRPASGQLSKEQQEKLNIQIALNHFVTAASLVQNFACTAPEVHPDGGSEHNFSTALIRKNDDGSLSIVSGCNKASVVKVLLAEAGKVLGEKLKANAANVALHQAQAARAAAIDEIAA